jgi:hypothetical protein
VHYFNFSVNNRLNSSASSAARSPCAVMGDGSYFFYTFYAEPKPGEGSDGRLGSWSRCSGSCSAWSADLYVYGGYSLISGNFSGSGGCAHGCVRRGFHTVGFHEHSAARAGDGLCTRDICDVYQRVVVAAEDVHYSPFLVSFAAAQNLPPPLWPLLPLGCLISGCLVTTVMATRVGWFGLASVLCGE